ncbi:MAG: HlyD family type I secretion periplasmic adaptor subunit [Burkholderiaceae bacterium]
MADKPDSVVGSEPARQRGGSALARLENLLVASGGAAAADSNIDAPKRLGLMVAALVFGGFGLWAALAPIDSAAHAIGQVTVKSFKKPVQHLEGGIVKRVLVSDGDPVQPNDVLLEMDNTQSLSQLDTLRSLLKAQLALEARLLAARDGKDTVDVPAGIDLGAPVAAAEMAAQQRIFQANKATNEGEISVLEQRIGQLESRVEGLQAVRESKLAMAASFADELRDFRQLLDEGFAEKSRLRELERNLALTNGDAADLAATIASTQIQIGETQLQILQLKNRLQSDVVKELADVQTRLQEFRERITGLADVVSRTEVRAPEAGVVNGLTVHTPGTVIPPGTIIAEIVPASDELIIEARVSPMDIDRVAVGQEASIRMTAMNSRTVPTLYGNVSTVSADILSDANGAQFYLARLALQPESLADLNGQPLVPGMPAEVFITTGARTFFQYLLQPLSDSVARSFRED